MTSYVRIQRTIRQSTFIAANLLVVLASACKNPEPRQRDTSPDVAPAAAAAAVLPNTDDLLISETGMGALQLGTTLGHARKLLPHAQFKRTSDGDGVALVEITVAPESSVTVFAGEDDREAQIDWSKSITSIETFSKHFHTDLGVHPGSLVTDVEKAYGPITKVEKSEIESREYITFERQPAYLTFRLDYTGIFPDGASVTNVVDPKGTIHSIAISVRSGKGQN